MKKKNRDDYDERYNETSNTAAGINTPKDHEDSGPLDMVSDAVGEFVDNVQHAFDGSSRSGHGEADELEREPDEYDHRALSNQQSRYDRHSY
ncbi:hypothetical protein [Paenibacillus glycinis]|uniref:DUF4025 domain-containing protein n=1 Tax=Paenibacillus glycinis TaxID=2697035 RepID=A0ABW9XNG4_9BACL|nr:hypothetical protein [Paenibacillus glycinis]NBD24063.1 hypothetical protein [Paenibacillus glycinis]